MYYSLYMRLYSKNGKMKVKRLLRQFFVSSFDDEV